ncbi:MAG: Uncharacterised protein [Cryomorphaceae bacterium]|nr:MAG: Uncharacterised protein [Cryomorphaceae bacterium]
MTSKINAKRKSHFGSVAFLSMLIDTGISIFILSQTEYSTAYPGLLFSMLFFGGLSVLLFSNYGMHPQLSSLVLLLAVAPELVNIFVVNSSSYPAIVLTAISIVLAFEANFPKWLRSALILIGISVLQLTKLDELGTYFIDLTENVLSALSILALTFYLVYRYFWLASTRAQSNVVISPAYVIEALKDGINPDFKYKFQPVQGEFLTSESFAPVQRAMPFLSRHSAPGTLETIPIMRMYLLNNFPVIETSNIVLEVTEEELVYANISLGEDGYELVRYEDRRQGFVVVPAEHAHSWKKQHAAPIEGASQDALNSPASSVAPSERMIGEVVEQPQEAQEQPQSTLLEATESEAAPELFSFELETSGIESTKENGTATPEPKAEKASNVAPMEEFRSKRRFDPKAGRDLKRLRNITKEEGTTDFQWNVPSK